MAAEAADAGLVLYLPCPPPFFCTPLKAAPPLWYNITAMTKEEMEKLKVAFRRNSDEDAYGWDDQTYRLKRMAVGIIATVIDYLRGDIEGLPSPLSDLARNTADSSHPSPPDNGDPDPISTEVMKRLGSLGLQSLDEIKGYTYDDSGHFLIHIKGRMADTGWVKDDPQPGALALMMDSFGIPFRLL